MSDMVQRFKDDTNKVIDVLIGIIDVVDKVSKKVNRLLAVKLTSGCDNVDIFLRNQQDKKLSYYLCIKITALDDFTTFYLYPVCQLHHHNYYMVIDNGEQLYCYLTQSGVCDFISNNSLEKQLLYIFR